MERPSFPIAFGKYELLERIAIGGMAEVFRARLVSEGGFEKHLVIKRILPHLSSDAEFVVMLIDEAKIAVALTHPNIVQIYDLGKIDGTYFIAMELIEGGDLKVVLKRCAELGQRLPIAHAVYVAIEVLKGLEYAHQKAAGTKEAPVPLNIIHRDISPPNILVSFSGEVRLVDFGIAKASVRLMETSAGVLKGKFEYMSPEQASGLTLDHRTDLFSISTVLYEMLTGTNPFDGQSEMQVLEKVRRARVLPPSRLVPEIPARLDQIVLKGLHRELEDRYQRAADMRADLQAFLFEAGHIATASRLAGFLRQIFAEEIRKGKMATADSAQEASGASPRVRLGAAAPRPPAAPDPRSSHTQHGAALDMDEDIPTLAGSAANLAALQPGQSRGSPVRDSTVGRAANLLQDFTDSPMGSAEPGPVRSSGEKAPVAVSLLHISSPSQTELGDYGEEEAPTAIRNVPPELMKAEIGPRRTDPSPGGRVQLLPPVPAGAPARKPPLVSPEPQLEDELELDLEVTGFVQEGARHSDPGASLKVGQPSSLPGAVPVSGQGSSGSSSAGGGGAGPAMQAAAGLSPQIQPDRFGGGSGRIMPAVERVPVGSASSETSVPLGAPAFRQAQVPARDHDAQPSSPWPLSQQELPLSQRGQESPYGVPVSEEITGKVKPGHRAPLTYAIGFLSGLIPGLLLATFLSLHDKAAIEETGKLEGPGHLRIEAPAGVETILNGNSLGSQYPIVATFPAGREAELRFAREGIADDVMRLTLEPGERRHLILLPPPSPPKPDPSDAGEVENPGRR